MSHPDYKHIGDPVDKVIEEVGELLQVIGKGKRFGWDNKHPGRSTTNIEELKIEWKDLFAAYNELIEKIESNYPICPHCNHKNLPGRYYCMNCYELLSCNT